tara:strand:- start:169 stop:291 length:123 start_codon:yes stop_codon:yes gene_type:complete
VLKNGVMVISGFNAFDKPISALSIPSTMLKSKITSNAPFI